MQNMKHKIFVDMDGVLVDFESAFIKKYGKLPDELIKEVGKKVFYREYSNTLPVVFWANLQWMQGGRELWKHVSQYNPTILSTPTADPQNKCIHGKLIWLQRELGLHEKPILSPKKYDGTGRIILAPMKYLFILDDPSKNILIDDREKILIPWREKGAIGIQHDPRNVKKTISTLEDILQT